MDLESILLHLTKGELHSINLLNHTSFFFFFWSLSQHMDFPGQGSDLSHSCDLCHSCCNAESLTHCVQNWTKSQDEETPLIPPHHSRNSCISLYKMKVYFRYCFFHNFKITYLISLHFQVFGSLSIVRDMCWYYSFLLYYFVLKVSFGYYLNFVSHCCFET